MLTAAWPGPTRSDPCDQIEEGFVSSVEGCRLRLCFWRYANVSLRSCGSFDGVRAKLHHLRWHHSSSVFPEFPRRKPGVHCPSDLVNLLQHGVVSQADGRFDSSALPYVNGSVCRCHALQVQLVTGLSALEVNPTAVKVIAGWELTIARTPNGNLCPLRGQLWWVFSGASR